MQKTTVRIEGKDLSSLTRVMEEKLGGYFEYFFNGTFVFVKESSFSQANEKLLNVIIVFLIGESESEVEVISGGGTGASESGGEEIGSNGVVVQLLRDICTSNHWSLVEEKAS